MKTSVFLAGMGFAPMAISMIVGVNPTNVGASAVILTTCMITAAAMAINEKDPNEVAASDGSKRIMYDCRVSWHGVDVKEVRR